MVAAMSDAPSLSPRSSGGKKSEDAARRGLVVSLFGGATFTFDGREIVLRNRKARAMIGYLALTERGEEQRERIAGLFWSESPEANARATLRQAVHEARETMLAAGCGALLSERTTIGLQPGSFTVDVETALRVVDGGRDPRSRCCASRRPPKRCWQASRISILPSTAGSPRAARPCTTA